MCSFPMLDAHLLETSAEMHLRSATVMPTAQNGHFQETSASSGNGLRETVGLNRPGWYRPPWAAQLCEYRARHTVFELDPSITNGQ